MDPSDHLVDLLDVTPQQDLPAGSFGAWLDAMEHALARGGDMNVPCGTCSACCRSSYFVHIGADEADTLAHVSQALRFPAPGGRGDWVLGFDQRGHCPMPIDDRCSIYRHRPLTCRRYDCRVFSAAGVDPADDDKPAIAERTRRWRYDHEGPGDRDRHLATIAAARFLLQHSAELGRNLAPTNLTQHVVLAVRVHRLFVVDSTAAGATDRNRDSAPMLAAIRASLTELQTGSTGT
jgi:hypothetical protein